MSRYNPEDLSEAVAMVAALLGGDVPTFARIVDKRSTDNPESMIAALAYLAKLGYVGMARLGRLSAGDLTAERIGALPEAALRDEALEVLQFHALSFADQLRDPPA